MSSKSRPVTGRTNDSYFKSNSAKTRQLTFREVVGTTDLMHCFHIRYQQYNNPAYKYFLNENPSELDIDAFDAYSRHWAVYSESGEIMGYARIIQKEENTSISKQIKEIINTHNIPILPLLSNDQYLPLHRYQPQSTSLEIDQFFQANKHAKVVELSRFMVPKGSPIRVSKFMVNAGLGIYKYEFKVDAVLLACNDTHAKFWSLYGFSNMNEGQSYSIGPLKSVNLHSNLTNIHPLLSVELEIFAAQYHLYNKITIDI